MKDKYIYPAIFTFYDDEKGKSIGITFPDLPGCVSCADTIEEAIHMAKEAMELHLFGMERDNDPIPTPSDPVLIQRDLESNQSITFVEAFMPRIRDSINNRSVNKMCTLPQWLLNAGQEAKINFSQTLQDALMQKLGIQREIKRRKSKQPA